MSDKDYQQIVRDLTGVMRDMHKGIPGTMQGFAKLADTAKAAGALDAKTKELMAVAISIALRCDGCIGFHVRGAVKLGATRAEMLDTIAVAIMMNGGPGTVYGAYALEAYDQFAGETST
ncbi:MAG: carboxymuconolactone decarboxylase family protein [Rhodospirillales bacterium]|nr:MAG: carboxymuconolactone decarboxylase family protein [Rhodospirillales bacterium]